jgi:hypothetical protein
MVTLREVKKGVTSVPGFVSEYGVTGGLSRWFGVVSNRAVRNVDGRSIFFEDWDVSIVLDACRADELENQRSNFDWIEGVDRFPSLASCTWNWFPRTLGATPDEALRDTTYVCANPFSSDFCSDGQFHELDEVWRYAWDEDKGTVYPRPVTDRAIHHWRNTDTQRLLVHYLQPHVPFLGSDADALGRSNFTHDRESAPDAWDKVTRGELSRERAISMYRDTLEYVLEDVELLLSNVDADDVVVTADHGEAFGEWGLYGHPPEIALPCLTQVPWLRTTAHDERTHVPREYEGGDDEFSREQRLTALGYKT